MRRGISLIELLVVIVVLPSALVAISAVFGTFLRDVPREMRLLQRNTSLLDMTEHLKSDMDRAESLPDSVDGLRRDDHTLLIKTPNQVVCYQLQDGEVTRTVLEGGESAGKSTWRFRDAVVAWQCRQQGGRPYAVELRTHFGYRVGGRTTDKLANAHVYFLNALGKGCQVR